MPDPVTCKFDKDPIKNERASVETIIILHGREVQIKKFRPEGHCLASRGCAE